MIRYNLGHSKCLHSSCNRLVFWLERKRSNKSIGIELWRIGVACLRREVMRRSTGIAQWTWQLTISIQNRNSNIEIINNKARHNLINAKCRWHSDWLDVTGSFRELLGQTKVMQIRQRETQIHQRETTNEICCLAVQYWPMRTFKFLLKSIPPCCDTYKCNSVA